MSTGTIAPPPRRPSASDRPEPKILAQEYFKSVGPRTYAVQVKEASNGNHFLVLTEGKRDEKTGEVRKTRLLVFSEDFDAFFDMLDKTRAFVRQNPVPEEVRKRQAKYWAGRAESATASATARAGAPAHGDRPAPQGTRSSAAGAAAQRPSHAKCPRLAGEGRSDASNSSPATSSARDAAKGTARAAAPSSREDRDAQRPARSRESEGRWGRR